MFTQSTLAPWKGAKKTRKRVGRGNGSGKGTFSGRGCNGQNARSWGGVHALFEGGQTPLARRIPKLKGFKAHNQRSYAVINLDDLEALASKEVTTVTKKQLVEHGYVRSENELVKLLGFGTISAAVEVFVDATSASAQKAVEAAGGSVTLPKND